MTSQHRVIKFKPRAAITPPGSPVSAQDEEAARKAQLSQEDSLNRALRAKNEASDYRHRMLMNMLALVFTLLLTGLGVWLATTITELRRTQDCLLVGRRDCSKMPPLRAYPPQPGHSI